MPKVCCPKCGSAKTQKVFEQYVQGSLWKHRFYRCLNCLHTWNRSQQLIVEKEIAKGFHKHYSAMPDT